LIRNFTFVGLAQIADHRVSQIQDLLPSNLAPALQALRLTLHEPLRTIFVGDTYPRSYDFMEPDNLWDGPPSEPQRSYKG
jgi:hypothetical protein